MAKRTKIVSTIGPASDSVEMLEKIILAGVNVCRLNFSHGDHSEHQVRIDRIKEVREKLELPVSIMMDLRGPEIRIGNFENDRIMIMPGEKFTFTTRELLGNQNIVSVSYKDFTKDVDIGTKILVDDGLVEFEVIDIIDDTDIITIAINSGEISNHKGINIPGRIVSMDAVSQRDYDDILFGIENDVDWIAGSFIRKKEDVFQIRQVLENNGGGHIDIISKIENQEGLDNLDEIIEASDGIMVARGDLGVEVLPEEIPMIQKDMIRRTYWAGKPVITATHMLDSMERKPRPTRAEVADVANAIIDGSSAVMLSGETAAGKFPLEAVQMMSRVAINVEKYLDYDNLLNEAISRIDHTVTNSITKSACVMARDLEVGAIIASTKSGYSALSISKFRPRQPIIASTSDMRTWRKLSLAWGVIPLYVEEAHETDKLISNSLNVAMESGLIEPGDVTVVTAGVPVGMTGMTNLIKVETAGEVIESGVGIGAKRVSGNIYIYDGNWDGFEDGDIVVSKFTDKDMNEYLERSAGMIIEEGGYTSHGAIFSINLDIPTIIGVKNATNIIKPGTKVTIDTENGNIYSI